MYVREIMEIILNLNNFCNRQSTILAIHVLLLRMHEITYIHILVLCVCACV